MRKRSILALAILLAGISFGHRAEAGRLRDWLQQHRSNSEATASTKSTDDDGFGFGLGGMDCARLQQRVERWGGISPRAKNHSTTATFADLPYGTDPAQKLDVYAPANAQNTPVILMIHGGAWCIGDKAMDNVVTNKTARWLPRGFIFVSANYPMLPASPVAEQANNAARALAYVQTHASEWGGDANKIILMGHSAGAHLVSLLSAKPKIALQNGAKPWLGTISLDTAVVSVPDLMTKKHPAFYDDAFGTDPAHWPDLSPLQQLSATAMPWLGVCSSKRSNSCPPNHEFDRALKAQHQLSRVIEQPLSHGEINNTLGMDNDYTRAVEDFMRDLDPVIAQHLTP